MLFVREDRRLVRFFNLRINAKDASFENINVGPNLSPFMPKDKITQFCSEFNSITEIYKSKEIPIYLRLFLYTDGSFFFVVRGPSFSFLLKILFSTYSLNNEAFQNIEGIKLNELYEIIIFKNFFFNKLIKLNSFILKDQIRNNFFRLHLLKISYA
jgi:ribosomal protein L11